MEYNLLKKSVDVPHTLLDTVSEQPVDVDLTLPDYCPDIERILRCMLIPKVYLANISGDRLAVEGGACVRVLYLDSVKGCIRSFEYTAPFSAAFELKDSPAHAAVYTDTKPEYMNCRALSPRKLSLHGAFSLYARVIVSRSMDYCAYEDGGDLMTDAAALDISELCGLCRDTFSVREEFPMSGRPEIAAFITHRMTVRITELKSIRDKLMLTGEGQLDLLYLSDLDSGTIESMSCTFPISRIVDCEGAGEECVIDARLDLMTYDLSLSDDALGGSAVVSVDAKLCFNALCRCEKQISLITDCYSTLRETEARYEPFSCACGVRRLCFSDHVKAAVSLGESIRRIIDLYAERMTVSAAISGGAPLLSSRMSLSVLYENAGGEIKSVGRDVDFSYNPSVDHVDSVEGLAACVESLSWRIADENTVEIRAAIGYHMTVEGRLSRNALSSVTADDEAGERERDGGVVLYYADRGERIWDVAKRYAARPDSVRDENRLEGLVDTDTLGDACMLIISQ
jgi:hypothetical protein